MKREPEALFQAVLEDHLGAAFVLDLELRYLAFNLRHQEDLARLYQTTPRVGVPALEVITKDSDRHEACRNWERALAGESVISETEEWEVLQRPLRGSDKQIIALLVSSQPHGHSQLQRALDLTDVAYWSYDGDTGSTVYSAGYFTMLGYQPQQFEPSFESWVGLIHPEDREATVASFRQFFQVPDASFHLEYRMKTASGGWRWILGKGRVTERDSRGLPRRVAGINVDVTQRRLMAQSLTESESRWNSLVDQAPVWIALIGRLGTVLFTTQDNPVLLGDSAVGHHWKDVLPPDYHQSFAEALGRVFSQGEPTVLETRLHLEQGTSVFENRIGPVREGGIITSMMMVSLDVTERVRQQEQLQKGTRRRQILLHLHQDATLTRQNILDRALDASIELTESQIGYLYFYSEETQQFTLHSWSKNVMEQCLVTQPQTTYQLGLTGYWGEAVRQRRAICENNFAIPTTFHRGMPPGHVALRRFLTVPVFEQERIVAVIGVANKLAPYDGNDTQELEALAEGLWQLLNRREAEETQFRLYQAIEHSPVAVVITDREGVIDYVNSRFGTLTGYAASEALGAKIGLISSEQTTPEVWEQMWTALRQGKDWQGEFVNERPSGELYPVFSSISPVRNREQEVTHFISIMEDLTERKKTLEILQRAARLETIGTLAAGVAHDFNNLLTSLLGYNAMLLRKLEPESPHRVYSDKIELAGRRAASLVSSLLSVGRQQRMTTSELDLAGFLQEQVPLLHSLIKPPLEFRVTGLVAGILVEADPGQLSQVVVNLVSNARDALGGQGHIELTMGAGDGPSVSEAWFRVSDNGPGIEPEIAQRIFDPFFTTKMIGGGTGLGLSIVNGIVGQHAGRIDLKTEVGKGAEFTVVLPRLGKPEATG